MKRILKLSVSLLFILTLIVLILPGYASAATTPAYPTSINGLPVILVETSTNDITIPPGNVTLVLLDTSAATVMESSTNLDLNNYLKNNSLPSNWSFEVYGGPGVTAEEIIKVQKENNDWVKQHGVFKLGPIQNNVTAGVVTPLNTAGPFQVDLFNDPQTLTLNYQTCNIIAPIITGNYEDSYAYFGNNVFTNQNYFLQSGQIYANSQTRLVWADTSTGTVAHNFSMSWIGGHNYFHSIFFYGTGSGGHQKWEMAVTDYTNGRFAYQVEQQALGTQLQYSINDSVFFENYNTHSNWYYGFNTWQIQATSATKGWGSVVNGSWRGWYAQWNSDTLYNNIYGAMSGSLSYYGTTTWYVYLIPLGTP